MRSSVSRLQLSRSPGPTNHLTNFPILEDVSLDNPGRKRKYHLTIDPVRVSLESLIWSYVSLRNLLKTRGVM